MPPRVGLAPVERNCKTRSDLEDRAAQLQAMRRALLDGAVPRAARKLHCSESAVYKMIDGSMRSPLEATCLVTDAALETHPRGRALALVDYLIDRYLTDDEIGAAAAARDATTSVAHLIRETGEAAEALLGAWEDGELSDEERVNCLVELADVKRTIAKIEHGLEKGLPGVRS